MNRRAGIFLILAAVAVAVSALLVLFRPSPSVPASGKIKVAATFFPVYDIAKTIGGDRIDTVLVLPPGASPHTFELTPEKVREIAGSRVIFKIGGVDDWIDAVGESVGAEKVVLNKGIEIKNYRVLSIGDEEEEEGNDPHYWLTMKNAKVIAEQIAEKMEKMDPEGAGYFSENLKTFKAEADAADKEIRSILAFHAGRKIVAFHNAWNYFAEEYGLKVVTSFEPSPGKEPSFAHIKALSDLMKKEGIRVIFSEPAFSDFSIRSLISDLHLELYVLYPESDLSPESSFIDTMVENARTIAQALSI